MADYVVAGWGDLQEHRGKGKSGLASLKKTKQMFSQADRERNESFIFEIIQRKGV
jgi:hypothetical protein